jgi:hypothetical protein
VDSFEFVQIPVALLLGFGMSEILAGWGHQLRHRDTQPPAGLQLVASAYVLGVSFRYLWIQWSTRPEAWDYGAYLFSAAPAVLLALAAHVVRFDPGIAEQDAKAQYARSRRPVCVLLAALPVLFMAREVYNAGALMNPRVAGPIFVATTLVFGWLATTSRPRSQWIGWSVAWALALVLWTSFFPTLSQPGS